MFTVHLGLQESTAMVASRNDSIIIMHVKFMCCFVSHHTVENMVTNKVCFFFFKITIA